MPRAKREWVRDNFTSGIDRRPGTAATQDRFLELQNVCVTSGQRIKSRPPVRIPADAELDAASQGLIGNDGKLYTFISSADAPATHGTGANVETLVFDSPQDIKSGGEWELLDAFFMRSIPCALIRHETDSEDIPWITRLHVWDSQRPTYVEDPGVYPGLREFSHNPDDVAESAQKPLSAEYLPRMWMASSHLWVSGVKGDVSFSGVYRPRIWNARSQADILANGLEYVFLVPKGSGEIEVIIPWDFNDLNTDQQWVSYVAEWAYGPIAGVSPGIWTPMKEGAAASALTYYEATRVASRFGGGKYETKLTLAMLISDDHVVRVRVIPAGHRFGLVSAPTLAVEDIFHAGVTRSKNASIGWPISATAFDLTRDGGVLTIAASGPGTGKEFTLRPQPSTDNDRTWSGGPGDYYGAPAYQWIEGAPLLPTGGNRFFVFSRKTIVVPKAVTHTLEQFPLPDPPGTYSKYGVFTTIYSTASAFQDGDVLVKGGMGSPSAVYYMIYTTVTPNVYYLKIITDSGLDWVANVGDFTAQLNSPLVCEWLKRPTTFYDYLYGFEVSPITDWYRQIQDQMLLQSGEDEAGILPASNLDQGESRQVQVLGGLRGRLLIGYKGSCQLWQIGTDPTSHTQIDVRNGIGIGDHTFPMAIELLDGALLAPGNHGMQALSLAGYQVNLLGNRRIGEQIHDLGAVDVLGIYHWPAREEWLVAATVNGQFQFLVLDLHPEAKVVAWATWASEVITDMGPSCMVALGDRLWFRDGTVQGYLDGSPSVTDFQDDTALAMHTFLVQWQPDHLGFPNRLKHLLEVGVAIEGLCQVSLMMYQRTASEETARFYPPKVASFQEPHPVECVGAAFGLTVRSIDPDGFSLHGVTLVFIVE